MTAKPWPDHLLTVAEFSALPEDNSQRYELEEGILIVSPRLTAQPHQRAIYRLVEILNRQLPSQWEALGEIEVVIDGREPAIVRVPDVIITKANSDTEQVAASDVLVAVEIISPGSRRKDTRVKPIEYAEAGIPYYWLIDLEPPATLIAYHLAGPYYQEAPAEASMFITTEPFPIRIAVPELVARR